MFLKTLDKAIFPFFLQCEAFPHKQPIDGMEKKLLHPPGQMQPQNIRRKPRDQQQVPLKEIEPVQVKLVQRKENKQQPQNVRHPAPAVLPTGWKQDQESLCRR